MFFLGDGVAPHKVHCLDWREEGQIRELVASLDAELDYIIAAGKQAQSRLPMYLLQNERWPPAGADLEIENGGLFYPRAKRVGKIFA